MIQLTKGTNVLDINLSDFSGAGQDVVQNGSFNDIGSDLVQNGDFAEIGSELVTNGDFSAVPLGGELVTDGNFPTPNVNWSLSSSFTIANNKLHCLSDGTYEFAYQSSVFEIGKSYVITFDITGWTLGTIRVRPTAESPFQKASANGSYSFFYVAVENTQLIIERDSGACDMFLENISVKEATNLVTNPNFTDTGSELVTNGDFSSGSGWNGSISVSGGQGTKTSSGLAYQGGVVAAEKSYQVSVDVASLGGAPAQIYAGGNNSAALTVGVQTIYITGGSTNDFIGFNNGYSGGVGAVFNSISVKELGEDWTTVEDTISFSENGLVMTSTEGTDVNVRTTPAIVEDGKSYKVTYTIHAIGLTGTNSIQYYTGSTLGYQDLPEQDEGTHTFYHTKAAGVDYWYFKLENGNASTTDTVTISSIVVQELGEGWNFNTPPWDVVSNGIASDGANSNDMNQSTWFPVLGKSYKIVYTIASITQGSYKITLGGQTTTPRSAAATYTEYITATDLSNGGGRLRIQIDNDNAIGTISSISVKEVGQDWTVQEGWTVEDNKAVCDGSLNKNINQNIGLITGKPYKIVFTVADYVSGKIDYNVGGNTRRGDIAANGTYTDYVVSDSGNFLYFQSNQTLGFVGSITNITVQQLDTNDRWVTFADPDSKSVMKLGQVDLEIDSSGNNCGVYQTGLIKPNKLYIITINMKATAAIYVEIAASLGTAVSAVIGTELLTTSYKEYSFEYVTPFAVDHDLQIHRLFGSGANQTISIDYVSMNGVDESQWTNDPTWDPFATSLVFVPTLTDESTNNSKQFTLNTSITDGGWDGRSLHGQVIINEFPTEIPASGIINLKQPDFLEGFYQVEIRGYLGTFYRVLGKCMAHLERTSTEDGYNRFESYNDTVTYKAYEE